MDLFHLVKRTPILQHSGLPNAEIYLKTENFQTFGSYKIRGIAELIKRSNPLKLRQGLLVASAGNMAQPVAYAAKNLKIPCTVFLPKSTPEIKKNAIRSLGAIIEEHSFQDIWKIVMYPQNLSTEQFFIHPTMTPHLLDGYASIAKEVLEDVPACNTFIIPLGVGGLSLGIARYLRIHAPDIKIMVCEPETAAPMHAALRAGRSVSITRIPSFVDAIGTPEVKKDVFEELAPLIENSLVVSLEEIKNAMRELFETHKIVVEPAGAVALAAAKKFQKNAAAEQHKHRIVAILSGGNISIESFKTIFS